MQSLKELPEPLLIQALEKMHLHLNQTETVSKFFREGDVVSFLIMSPTIIGFTLCIRDGQLRFKIGGDENHPKMIWKETGHYLEWLEGKRGMMKMMVLRQVKIQGGVPGWVSMMTEPLRQYVRTELLKKPAQADQNTEGVA